MPYKPPKLTPQAAARVRAKGRADARTRTTLRTPGRVVDRGIDPLGLPLRVTSLARLAWMTGGRGRFSLGEIKTPKNLKDLRNAAKTRKNTVSQWSADNPRTKVIKAYARAPFEKDRNIKPTPKTTGAQRTVRPETEATFRDARGSAANRLRVDKARAANKARLERVNAASKGKGKTVSAQRDKSINKTTRFR